MLSLPTFSQNICQKVSVVERVVCIKWRDEREIDVAAILHMAHQQRPLWGHKDSKRSDPQAKGRGVPERPT